MNTPIIIKLGGSLIQHQQDEILPSLGKIIGEFPANHPLLIVPGGGPFADAVRLYGRKFNLKEETCHLMALMAMDQYAFLLQEFIPGSSYTELIPSFPYPVLPHTSAPQILLTSRFFSGVSSAQLPRTWEVTSDSLSAYLAKILNASLLIIVKSTDIDPCVKEPDVDSFFLKLLPLGIPLWFINGKYPERLHRLFHTGRTTGIYLPPNSLTGSINP